MALRKILHSAFVSPFTNIGLSRTYIAVVLAAIGFSGVNLYLAFDYAGLGLGPVLAFFLGRYGFANFIYMPVTFNFLKRFRFRTFCFFAVPAQIAVLAFFVLIGVPGESWHIAFLLTVLEMPFWVAFHIAMLLNTSDVNRGNEVSLSDAGITIGSVIGFTLGGLALQFGFGPWVVLVCGLASFLGWAVLAALLLKLEKAAPLIPPQGASQSEFAVLRADPVRVLGTVLEGMFQSVTGVLMPVWMKILGAAGALAGILQSITVGLKIVMTPLTGYLVNEGKGRDATLGAVFKFTGWLPWLFVQAPWVVLLSSPLWTAGAHLFSNGLLSRWYSRGGLSTMTVREVALGFGRCAGVGIGLPLLYYSFTSYVAFALAVTVALMFISRLMRRRICSDSALVTEMESELV